METRNAKVMIQFHYQGEGAPDVAGAAERFGIDIAAIDRDFGVIVTDPDAQLATILVTKETADLITPQLATNDVAGEGVFGNARIEPFGKPEG